VLFSKDVTNLLKNDSVAEMKCNKPNEKDPPAEQVQIRLHRHFIGSVRAHAKTLKHFKINKRIKQ